MGIFECDSYREVIELWIREGKGRGRRKALSESLGVQTSMLSQVLGGQRDFSTEKILELAELMTLGSYATEFLLALHGRDRAGTHKLRGYMDRRVEELRKLGKVNTKFPDGYIAYEDPAVQEEYGSTWVHSGVRNALRIANLDSAKAIARALSLPLAQVKRSLEFLAKNGLAADLGGGRFGVAGPHGLALTDGSKTFRFRYSLRGKAMTDITLQRADELQNSAIFALTQPMYEKVRKSILKTLHECLETARECPKPTFVVGFNIDFFRLSEDPDQSKPS